MTAFLPHELFAAAKIRLERDSHGIAVGFVVVVYDEQPQADDDLIGNLHTFGLFATEREAIAWADAFLAEMNPEADPGDGWRTVVKPVLPVVASSAAWFDS